MNRVMGMVSDVLVVAALIGVPVWAIVDVALDARDKRRNVRRTRYSIAKYVIVLVALLLLGGMFLTV